MFRLDSKTAIVTGAAQGIGRAVAEVLAEAGASVFLCDLSPAGEAVAQGIRDGGGQATFVRADVTDSAQIGAVFSAAGETTGRVDVVCINAAFTSGTQHDVAGATDEEWENNFRVGLMGAQYCTQRALPWMIKQGSGSIVVISSIQGLVGCASSTPYSSVKAGQIGFVKSTACDLGRHNIRVNAICPGPIRVSYSPQPGSPGYETQVSQTMLRRVGQPREVGYAVLYLAADESSFITGAVLPVDGGWTAM